nr:phage tail sheath subtilisin-like domain-containing protein [Dyella lutea]
MNGGTTNPDVSAAIAAMGDAWYQAIVMPYTDAANLTLLEAELLDRFGGIRQIDGVAYAAFRGTAAATDTFGTGRNSALVSCMGTSIAPQPPYLWAAVIAAVAAFNLANDPVRPLQTLPLTGILPPAQADQFTFDERNLQLHSGIATHKVDAGGNVLIERQITMYQKNASDIADTSYLDVNTIATMSYIRYATRARITSKYPRHKLAGDTVKVAPGQAIVTPSVIRAELVGLGSELLDAGIIEDLAQFKADLVVQINANDPNRVDVLSSPNLVNQLRIFAEQIQFIL